MVDAAELEHGIAVVRLDHPRAPVRRRCTWVVPCRRTESKPNIRFRSIPENPPFPGWWRSRGHDEGAPSVSTVSDQPTGRAPLPTHRGRQTQAAIDTAARIVISRK